MLAWGREAGESVNEQPIDDGLVLTGIKLDRYDMLNDSSFSGDTTKNCYLASIIASYQFGCSPIARHFLTNIGILRKYPQRRVRVVFPQLSPVIG